MAVTFDANASASVTANATTAITSSNLTISAGSNLAVVVQIAWSGTVTAPAITWDNLGTPQTVTAITGATSTSTPRVDLWGLVNPTSGAKQLRAAWTTSRDVVMNQTSWTGVNQTGGATSFPHGTGATGTSATITSTVTSAVGNATMACHASALNAITAVNNTSSFINNTPANMSTAGNRAAGAASVTLTASVPSTTWTSAGTDIAAAAIASDTQEWRGCYPTPRRFTPNIGY